jgi:hypothetical protein
LEARVVWTVAEPVIGADGVSYEARICGRPHGRRQWESWIEFVPASGAPVLRSRRETTQADLRNLEGWARRLTRVYLEGSLARTLEMQSSRPPSRSQRVEVPHFDAPSPEPRAARPPPDDAVLNPFLDYRRGEPHLRSRLEKLAPSELRLLARAYGIDRARGAVVEGLGREALIELIVAWVRERT